MCQVGRSTRPLLALLALSAHVMVTLATSTVTSVTGGTTETVTPTSSTTSGQCAPPCLNNGTCINSACDCSTGDNRFFGDQCERLNVTGSVIDSTVRTVQFKWGTAIKITGYSFSYTESGKSSWSNKSADEWYNSNEQALLLVGLKAETEYIICIKRTDRLAVDRDRSEAEPDCAKQKTKTNNRNEYGIVAIASVCYLVALPVVLIVLRIVCSSRIKRVEHRSHGNEELELIKRKRSN